VSRPLGALAGALVVIITSLSALAAGACAAVEPPAGVPVVGSDLTPASLEVATEPPLPLDGPVDGRDLPAAAEASPTPVADQPAPPHEILLAGGTRVVPVGFYSTTLDLDTWYYVILPPDYDLDDQRYPVLYMLHGAYGGASEWVEIGLPGAADDLWSELAMPPFIIVLPEGGASYYLNHADGGPRWGDYIAGDVVQQVDRHFRTIDDPAQRAIGGLSMGGDGALQLALHHPDIFGIVGAHSPTTRLSYERIPGPFYGDVEYWQENNPLWLIEHTDAATQLKIWIDVGQDDVWRPSAEALHQALLDLGVEHEFGVFPGSHEAEYWEAYQFDYLRFYGRAFGGVGPDATAALPSLGAS
jgi:S-formylglutathione hydrolase FrmB